MEVVGMERKSSFRRESAQSGGGLSFDADARFLANEIDHLAKIAVVRVELAKLPVRAGSVLENPAKTVHFLAAAKLVDDVVNELEELFHQDFERDFAFLAEIDELALDSPPGAAPLVLLDERVAVVAKAEVLRPQLKELGADRLDERGDRDGLVEPHGHVADAEFDGLKERMGPQVPPDLLAVVDRVRRDENSHELVEFRGRRKHGRNPRARESFENLGAIALPTGV